MAQLSRSNESSFPVVSFVTKGFSTIARPFLELGEAIIHSVIPEEGDENDTDFDEEAAAAALDDRLSLEGTLYHRKGKSTGRTPWKRRRVILDFENGGSLSIFQLPKKDPSKVIRKMYTKIHRSLSINGGTNLEGDSQDLLIYLSCEIPWTVKDVDDSSSFLVEIPTDNHTFMVLPGIQNKPDADVESLAASFDGENSEGGTLTLQVTNTTRQSLTHDFETARKKKKPVRFYFQCPRKENEKTLWLRAFAKLSRLSNETRRKYFFFETIGHLTKGSSRIRTDTSAQFLRESRQLEMGTMNAMREMSVSGLHDDVEELLRSTAEDKSAGGHREFRVEPNYCYPHTWMTREEMKEESILPSSTFYDLRQESLKGLEIGVIRVEVLSCLGLPKSDRSSETDAVVYLVCGAYAFATDVIPDNKNPIWLKKTRRACIFPVDHGYARLYVGVFDADNKVRDDFAGRVVIDLARLRPGSEYDVMLPLRLSAHVYSRRPRGAIRLRFQLDWKSERAALMSYIPRKVKFRDFQPRRDTTVACTNAKSFRNVAITIHGADLPGKFSFNHFKAVTREMNFTRKMMVLVVLTTIKNTISWVNPALSAFVFFAWMHCVYLNSFALVPAYFLSFLLLLMIRNYARYGIDGPASRHFLQPTWEEMFLALVKPSGTQNIEPIEMTTRILAGAGLQTSLEQSVSLVAIPKHQETKTHKPLGKRLLRGLGFLESKEELDGMTPDERHLEFPFSRGSDYPKHLIKDSLVVNVTKREKSKGKNNKAAGSIHQSKTIVEKSAEIPSLETDEYFPSFDDDDDGSDENETITELKHRNSSLISNSTSYDEDELSNSLPSQHSHRSEIPYELLPPYLRIPEQDIDRQGPSSGTKLSDDMAEIKEQMHKFTCHLFNDKTHIIKHNEAVYFGSVTKQGTKRRKHDVDTELQRLLQTGQYSHGNIIVSRIGQYLEPLVGGAQAWLCGCRAAVNIYTWQDPFLSFWVSLLGIVTVAILFVFPWRIFLFAVGLLVVGPQNYIFRWAKESRERRKPQPPRPRSISSDEVSLIERFPDDQQLFAGHPALNHLAAPIDQNQIDPREVHYVVVPYSPLMYQRFYDWPPESAYAHVKKKPPLQLEQTNQEQNKSVHRNIRSIVEIDPSVFATLREYDHDTSLDRSGSRVSQRRYTKNKDD